MGRTDATAAASESFEIQRKDKRERADRRPHGSRRALFCNSAAGGDSRDKSNDPRRRLIVVVPMSRRRRKRRPAHKAHGEQVAEGNGLPLSGAAAAAVKELAAVAVTGV